MTVQLTGIMSHDVPKMERDVRSLVVSSGDTFTYQEATASFVFRNYRGERAFDEGTRRFVCDMVAERAADNPSIYTWITWVVA
jgi:hypothetical protein